MLGPTLIGHEVVQVRQPCEKRLLVPVWMVKPFHGKQLPVNGVMRLIQQGARHRHLRVFEHCIPARLFVLEPAPYARAVGDPSRHSDVIGKVPEPLPQGKHPQALAHARPVHQRVELRTKGLTDRGRDGHEFLRELGECVAQAGAQARSREERAQTLRGAVKAIGEHPSDPIGRLMLECRALKLPMGLGKSRGTGLLGVPQMPDDATTDDRGQKDLLGEAVTVLFIREEICGQGQATPGQYPDQTVLAECADEAIERHRGNMADHGAELQTQVTVCGQQGIAGHLRSHLARAQDEVRQHGEHRFAPRTLDAPDGETTQPDTDIMGVAGQVPAAATEPLVFQLKADREDESHHQFDKGSAVAKQLKVGRFIMEIDGDSVVLPRLCGCCAQCVTPRSSGVVS